VGNLLGNAIKFTREGSVRLNAGCADNGRCRIRVSDTGIGIAPEHQRYIFDEFFQLSNPERDRNKGTGLGLAICKRLVDAMGGTLEVQSEPGKGSTFTVTLPTAGVPLPAATR
jgi:signal transduction histidine kinase